MTARVDGPYCAIHDAAHPPCDPLDAGVLSSDAPVVLSPAAADRVAALIEERPGPTEAMRALFAERRPCAGWAPDGYFPPGLAYELRAGEFSARVDEAGVDQAGDSEWGWSVAGPSPYERIIVRRNYAPTLDAAQLAAEDALLAVADEIRRAVGAVRGGKNPRESLAAIMATHPRDWSLDRGDAWIYGIVCGWDEDGEESAMDEVAARHGWSAATVDRLRRLHAEFASPTPPAAPRR